MGSEQLAILFSRGPVVLIGFVLGVVVGLAR